MKIAIDVSPLTSGNFLQHRVRGVGAYIDNLKVALLQHYSSNTYIFFTRGEKLPKSLDLVHYPYFEPFFLTLPLRKPFPTVVTVHDVIPFVFPTYFPPGVRGNLKWVIQKLSLQGASTIIADSECSKRDIVKYANISNAKIDVIYLAASKVFKPLSGVHVLSRVKNKYKLPEKFVLYVGDVTWNKNVPRLLEAIKKLNLTLVMVGKAFVSKDFDMGNPWNQDLVKVGELAKGDKRIIRLGFVPRGDLVLLYNAATVFAMPSLYEGFGLPVLEAMACGTPVVTARSGSIPEVAQKSVYYVDPYDVDTIANGIGEVFFTQQLQKELSRKGLMQVKKFSWKKTAEQTVEVYKRLV